MWVVGVLAVRREGGGGQSVSQSGALLIGRERLVGCRLVKASLRFVLSFSRFTTRLLSVHFIRGSCGDGGGLAATVCASVRVCACTCVCVVGKAVVVVEDLVP